MSASMRRNVRLFAAAGLVATSLAWASAQRGATRVAIDPDDIGGVVTSVNGPEAGVWVIAETTQLPTRFIRSVVTDDQGRYVIPDLPRGATYDVFVRGYGLVDSPRVKARIGQPLDLKAIVAPDPKAAAQYYPANYWLALMDAPSAKVPFQIKTSCLTCHQLGDKATREIPANLGTFKTGLEAWDHRVRVGPSGRGMAASYMGLGNDRKAFADWTDRIAAGAYPKQAPPRPTGIERNLVVTLWDWGGPTSFSHTHAATDRRHPTVNANGKIYAPDRSHDELLWLDPSEGNVGTFKIPRRETSVERAFSILEPSPYWGQEQIWEGTSNARSANMDQLGRVWIATRIRGNTQPAFCTDPANRFAQYYPLKDPSGRQVAFFDPKTQTFTTIDTCFTADHNEFGETADNPLFFGQNGGIGWINTTQFDRTHDEQASQGWCPMILDTNGDGKISKGWTEPNQPVDPTRDHRISLGCYSISVSPTDGSVWCLGIGGQSKSIVRIDRGANPPETCKAEVYTPPVQAGVEVPNDGGIEVDTQGIVWTNWRSSDHVMAFDRRKCKTVSAPNAAGTQCPEGWTQYRTPGPTLQGSTSNADMNYLLYVDRSDAAGLGKDTKFTFGTNSDAAIALTPAGQFVTLRVPYPLGFYTRNAHARIDNANAGWKGRALWSTYMTYAIWHAEGGTGTTGGKGQKAKVVKFQVRPNPLAK